MPKNIIVISNIYPTTEKPARGIFVKNVVELLRKNSFEVELITPGKWGNSLFKKIISYLIFYFRILKKGTFSSKTLYVHYISHSVIPVFILSVIGRNIIVNLHGSDILGDSPINKIVTLFTDFVIKKCDAIVVPSTFFSQLINEKFELSNPKKVFISPSGGVDRSLFRPKSYEFNISNEQLTIGYVSRLEKKKGWEIYIEAIKMLKEHSSLDLKAFLIGSGSDQKTVLNRISSLGLEGVVEVYRGVKQEKLPEFYSTFDIFIFPTLYQESLGLVAIEAISVGTPVIASDIGAIGEYITEDYNGYLFEPGNPEDLKKKIYKYHALSLEGKKKLYQNCITFSKKYDRQKVGQELGDFISKFS